MTVKHYNNQVCNTEQKHAYFDMLSLLWNNESKL
jgi:hypothetical protein